jgi:ribosome maturation protein Sdo1
MRITTHQLRRLIKEAISVADIGIDEMRSASRAVGDDIQDIADYLGIPVEDAAQIRADIDQGYEDRHSEDQEDMGYYLAQALEVAVRENPGMDGQTILSAVRKDPIFQGTADEEIWNMADEMIEDGTLFFDVEEDAWYYAPEFR